MKKKKKLKTIQKRSESRKKCHIKSIKVTSIQNKYTNYSVGWNSLIKAGFIHASAWDPPFWRKLSEGN